MNSSPAAVIRYISAPTGAVLGPVHKPRDHGALAVEVWLHKPWRDHLLHRYSRLDRPGLIPTLRHGAPWSQDCSEVKKDPIPEKSSQPLPHVRRNAAGVGVASPVSTGRRVPGRAMHGRYCPARSANAKAWRHHAFTENGTDPRYRGAAARREPVRRGDGSERAAVRPAAPAARSLATVTPPACDVNLGSDIKVNQNCLNVTDSDLQGRGQAQNETYVAADPLNSHNIVAGYNDYRRGDSTCGISYSTNGGTTWADATMPNGFVRGTAYGNKPREYMEGSGDPSVAWDTRGNAYYTCLQFKRGAGVTEDADQSSAFYVYRSTGTKGASWNFTGRPVAEHNDVAGAGDFLLDKPLMSVDDGTGSPFRDRIYVTWTTYAADGTVYIYEAHSADYGEHFSAAVLVSKNSALCPRPLSSTHPLGSCDNNQFSQPFSAPDGTLYVVFDNYNNAHSSATDNHSQVLVARSTDGGATFSAPVKVGDFYDLPDCATYQGGADLGAACVPEKGATAASIFRAANYPYGAVDPQHPGTVA